MLCYIKTYLQFTKRVEKVDQAALAFVKRRKEAFLVQGQWMEKRRIRTLIIRKKVQ